MKIQSNILSHRHGSFARLFPDIGYEPFVWNQVGVPRRVILHKPQSLVDYPCEVLGPKRQDLIFASLGTGDIA